MNALAHVTRHVLADVRSLERGRWSPAAEGFDARGLFGLLVLDGMLVRRVAVGRRYAAELLGEGDLIRPDQEDADPYATVAQSAEWRVLSPVRVAVLDHELVTGLAGLAGVLPELAGRAIQRSRALVLRGAIGQIPNLADRVHLVLWHLADRWGQRDRGAVTLRVQLDQNLLAELASAKRTSVNAALRELCDRGAVESRGGYWALWGEPPGDLLVRV